MASSTFSFLEGHDLKLGWRVGGKQKEGMVVRSLERILGSSPVSLLMDGMQ